MTDARAGGSPPIVLNVCVSCKAKDAASTDRPGETLLAELRALRDATGAAVSVRAIQCLSVCSRPCTVSLSSPGRYTYVFGDLDPAAGAGALLDCTRTYAGNEHGYMLWRERPEALRRGIVARIPPTDWEPDDGRHPR